MQGLINTTNEEVVTMTSLELVELINNFRREEGNNVLKRHDVLLRDIDNEIEALKNLKIDVHNFVETSYKDSWNRDKRCYKMNKSGIMQMLNKESALVRYKTQQYIEILENKLKQDPYQHLSTEMKALIMHDKKIQAVQKEVIEVKDNLNEFKDDIPLFAVECEEVAKAVKRVGTQVLGGKASKAYKNKSLRAKVYSDIYREIKREFDVNSYKAIKRRYLEDVLDIVEKYRLTIALKEQIGILNNQVIWE